MAHKFDPVIFNTKAALIVEVRKPENKPTTLPQLIVRVEQLEKILGVA
jgi:hypothetical protein